MTDEEKAELRYLRKKVRELEREIARLEVKLENERKQKVVARDDLDDMYWI